MNCANNIAIVISKGDITLDFKTGSGYLISLGSGDLTLKSGASTTYGNFSTKSEFLNNVFKGIFKFKDLEDILGGGTGGDADINGESNTIIYPSDVIKNKVWKLVK